MAISSANGKYMALENVRVFYDKDSDKIIITSRDPDIPADSKGFKISVNSDNETGSTLRRMLGERGFIPDYEKDYSPDLVKKSEMPQESPWHTIPLGKYSAEDITMWDTRKFPNLFIVGSAGSGKTNMSRHIISHCLNHQKNWEVAVFDVDFPLSYTNDFPDISSIGATIDGVELRLFYYLKELQNREDGSSSSSKNILLVVDSLPTIVQASGYGGKSPAAKLGKAQAMKISKYLFQLAERGPAVGIHLVVTAQRPHTTDTMSIVDFLSHFQAKVICGNIDPIGLRLFTGKNVSPHLKPRVGKSYLLNSDGEKIFQATNASK